MGMGHTNSRPSGAPESFNTNGNDDHAAGPRVQALGVRSSGKVEVPPEGRAAGEVVRRSDIRRAEDAEDAAPPEGHRATGGSSYSACYYPCMSNPMRPIATTTADTRRPTRR